MFWGITNFFWAYINLNTNVFNIQTQIWSQNQTQMQKWSKSSKAKNTLDFILVRSYPTSSPAHKYEFPFKSNLYNYTLDFKAMRYTLQIHNPLGRGTWFPGQQVQSIDFQSYNHTFSRLIDFQGHNHTFSCLIDYKEAYNSE